MLPEMMITSPDSGEASVLSESAKTEAPQKKKRNLPGMPDPNAEVIALSPTTLLATNRFVCEICNKGFQRDQNLQLHRRGHNLPWKLKQRTTKEVRKRVYVCPEPTCVHHDPARALGDLTGIKKHFSRKHGEKKWKCERCSKKYAVQSDWKAHLKTCGSREYRCDCGTLFSRRDSFITHRAFCDALAVENARAQTSASSHLEKLPPSPPPSPPVLAAVMQSAGDVSPALSNRSPELTEDRPCVPAQPIGASCLTTSCGSGSCSAICDGGATVFSGVMSNLHRVPYGSSGSVISDLPPVEPISLSLSSPFYYQSLAPPFPLLRRNFTPGYPPPPQPAMSATALLQKAAQIGATSSKGSLLRGLGLAVSPTSAAGTSVTSFSLPAVGPAGSASGLTGQPATVFWRRPATLDLLGLGSGDNGGAPGTATSRLSALLSSMEGVSDVAAPPPFDLPRTVPDRPPML